MAAMSEVSAPEAHPKLKSCAGRALNNCQPTYVPITDTAFHTTGLRGRKGMLFYGLVIFLFVFALANLGVTMLLLSVLRIGYGMESMEFIRPGLLLRFLSKVDMGIVIPHTGQLAGFANQDLLITGDSQSVILKASGKEDSTDEFHSGATIEVSPEWTVISNVDEFRIRSPDTGENIFSTKYDDFKLPSGVPNLSVKEAHVSKISSPSSESLEISSAYQTILKGNEGLTMEGKEISWTAGLDIYLKSVNQSIILDGHQGLRVSMSKIPIASKPIETAPRWFKVCICVPNGRVFRVPVRDQGFGCKDVRFPASINPCS